MEPILGQIDVISVFDSEKFEFPFSYDNNNYNVIVYFRSSQTIDLEGSVLVLKTYTGEYIIDGAKYNFTLVICKEHYYHSKVNDFYWYTSSYNLM